MMCGTKLDVSLARQCHGVGAVLISQSQISNARVDQRLQTKSDGVSNVELLDEIASHLVSILLLVETRRLESAYTYYAISFYPIL